MNQKGAKPIFSGIERSSRTWLYDCQTKVFDTNVAHIFILYNVNIEILAIILFYGFRESTTIEIARITFKGVINLLFKNINL